MKTNLSLINLKKLCLVACCCFLIVGFSACNKNNDNVPEISYSNLAGINATENANVDFYINNAKANPTALAPGQVVGYFSVLPTSNNVDFRISTTSSMIGSSTFNCDANSFYSAFLGDGNVVVTLQDDRTPPQTGKARIRFLNISPYLNGAVDFGATGSSTKLITGISYKTASIYLDVDPSVTSISIYNAGSTTPVINVPVNIQANHVYVFYITGSSNGGLAGNLLTQI